MNVSTVLVRLVEIFTEQNFIQIRSCGNQFENHSHSYSHDKSYVLFR